MSDAFLERLKNAAAHWRRQNSGVAPCPDCDKDIALAKTKLASGVPVNIPVEFPCVLRTVVLRECAASWACLAGSIHEISVAECVNCEKRRW